MSPRDSPDDVPYSTALATADRSHLYSEYDLDRSGVTTDADRTEPPADYGERRAALLSFYGGRCGRCLAPIDRSSRGEASLGYLYSVGDPTWALESLVAVCEGCYDLLSVRTPTDLDRPHAAPADAPQFPAPRSDPRIAVERAPVSGREAWLRKRLRERTADAEDRRINAPARDCTLGLATGARRATAMGEALCGDWTRPPDEPRLVESWEGLPAETRGAYAACAVDRTAVVETAPEGVRDAADVADAAVTSDRGSVPALPGDALGSDGSPVDD